MPLPSSPATDSPPPPLDRPALLAALRARIAQLDRSGAVGRGDGVPLCPDIDAALPGGGLARAGVHEVLAAEPGAATGFCALALARAARPPGGPARGSLLWIAAEPDLWPPGLAQYGLSPADLVLVQARRPADGLWAMEESLRCPGVAGVVLAIPELDMTAARRLQLAAEAGGALGLLLRPGDMSESGATVALTRWRVDALAGAGGLQALGDPRWRLELLRCRGGRPAAWDVAWRAAAAELALDMPAREERPARHGMMGAA
jgi:protein ImuA